MVILFALASFLIPLTFFPKTSELFEFNKMVLTYIFTVLIVSSWTIRMILEKRFIFRRTLLDYFIIGFLLSQTISTFLSIDFRTSILGYYSRFHGGLLSSICYSLLYWAFVSNVDKKGSKKVLLATISSAVIVSIWAILEHFGKSISCIFVNGKFDVDCWVQDVALRVFATFGQPNWLAAWIVAIVPITWSNIIFPAKRDSTKNLLIWYLLAMIFFLVLLFTKSRSGILGFAVSFVAFWILAFWINKKAIKKVLSHFILNIFYLVIAAGLTGTPWTPRISEITNHLSPTANQTPTGTVLEAGGTESGKIRKIVWQGAIDAWKAYPIFGSGVETFAFIYYKFRPVQHNLVSEWNFLYNKAHNEYLNFLATTGIVGLLAYSALIIASIIQILNSYAEREPVLRGKSSGSSRTIFIPLFAGYISILVTNFFGFSVVPVALLFFLFPALAITATSKQESAITNKANLSNLQKISIPFVLCFMLYALFTISRYWYADHLYAQALTENKLENPEKAISLLQQALTITPNEPIFRDELAQSYSNLATAQSAAVASLELQKVISMSPYNVKLLKSAANIYAQLSSVDPSYLTEAHKILLKLSDLAPTDASIFYTLATSYARLGKIDKTITTLKKTIDLKPDYAKARNLLGYIYVDLKKYDLAREQFKYILDHIDPNDQIAKKALEDDIDDIIVRP